MKLIDVLQNYV